MTEECTFKTTDGDKPWDWSRSDEYHRLLTHTGERMRMPSRMNEGDHTTQLSFPDVLVCSGCPYSAEDNEWAALLLLDPPASLEVGSKHSSTFMHTLPWCAPGQDYQGVGGRAWINWGLQETGVQKEKRFSTGYKHLESSPFILGHGKDKGNVNTLMSVRSPYNRMQVFEI